MQDLPFDLVYSEELYDIAGKTTVVMTTKWENLTMEEKTQLSKISDALKMRINPALSVDAFRIVAVESLDLSTWTTRPERLIYFGEAIKGLAFYEVIEANGTRMVLSESLASLIGDEPARTKLWQALKQLFST